MYVDGVEATGTVRDAYTFSCRCALQVGDQDRRIKYLDEETELFKHLTDIESVRKYAQRVHKNAGRGGDAAAAAAEPPK